jgi:sugar phosphate isomerase/epimerase
MTTPTPAEHPEARRATEPKLSICEFTTPDTSFERDLELCREAGATGVSICEFKLREGDEHRQRDAFEASGLHAALCMPSNISPLPASRAFPGPTDVSERVELMCGSVRRLAPFRPATIVVLTGSGEGRAPADARRAAVEGLRRVATLAGELGTRISLEPQRVDLVPGRSLVTTIPEAVEFVAEVDEPAIDVMYDVYHLWDTDDVVALSERHARAFGGVQVSDWRAETRGFMDRLLPGEGLIDLPVLLRALDEGGFAGWFDLEVFSDDGRYGSDYEDSLWKRPPSELVRDGLAGFRRAWDARWQATAARGAEGFTSRREE